MDIITLALAKKYANSVAAIGGTLSNIVRQSDGSLVFTYTPTSGSPVNFNAGVVADGRSIQSGEINESGHLVLTFDDGDTVDCGVVKGEDGVGVPVGGQAGQVLSKKSGTDYDTEWVDQTGGEGSDYITQPEYTNEPITTTFVGNVDVGAIFVFTSGTQLRFADHTAKFRFNDVTTSSEWIGNGKYISVRYLGEEVAALTTSPATYDLLGIMALDYTCAAEGDLSGVTFSMPEINLDFKSVTASIVDDIKTAYESSTGGYAKEIRYSANLDIYPGDTDKNQITWLKVAQCRDNPAVNSQGFSVLVSGVRDGRNIGETPFPQEPNVFLVSGANSAGFDDGIHIRRLTEELYPVHFYLYHDEIKHQFQLWAGGISNIADTTITVLNASGGWKLEKEVKYSFEGTLSIVPWASDPAPTASWSYERFVDVAGVDKSGNDQSLHNIGVAFVSGSRDIIIVEEDGTVVPVQLPNEVGVISNVFKQQTSVYDGARIKVLGTDGDFTLSYDSYEGDYVFQIGNTFANLALLGVEGVVKKIFDTATNTIVLTDRGVYSLDFFGEAVRLYNNGDVVDGDFAEINAMGGTIKGVLVWTADNVAFISPDNNSTYITPWEACQGVRRWCKSNTVAILATNTGLYEPVYNTASKVLTLTYWKGVTERYTGFIRRGGFDDVDVFYGIDGILLINGNGEPNRVYTEPISYAATTLSGTRAYFNKGAGGIIEIDSITYAPRATAITTGHYGNGCQLADGSELLASPQGLYQIQSLSGNPTTWGWLAKHIELIKTSEISHNGAVLAPLLGKTIDDVDRIINQIIGDFKQLLPRNRKNATSVVALLNGIISNREFTAADLSPGLSDNGVFFEPGDGTTLTAFNINSTTGFRLISNQSGVQLLFGTSSRLVYIDKDQYNNAFTGANYARGDVVETTTPGIYAKVKDILTYNQVPGTIDGIELSNEFAPHTVNGTGAVIHAEYTDRYQLVDENGEWVYHLPYFEMQGRGDRITQVFGTPGDTFKVVRQLGCEELLNLLGDLMNVPSVTVNKTVANILTEIIATLNSPTNFLLKNKYQTVSKDAPQYLGASMDARNLGSYNRITQDGYVTSYATTVTGGSASNGSDFKIAVLRIKPDNSGCICVATATRHIPGDYFGADYRSKPITFEDLYLPVQEGDYIVGGCNGDYASTAGWATTELYDYVYNTVMTNTAWDAYTDGADVSGYGGATTGYDRAYWAEWSIYVPGATANDIAWSEESTERVSVHVQRELDAKLGKNGIYPFTTGTNDGIYSASLPPVSFDKNRINNTGALGPVTVGTNLGLNGSSLSLLLLEPPTGSSSVGLGVVVKQVFNFTGDSSSPTQVINPGWNVTEGQYLAVVNAGSGSPYTINHTIEKNLAGYYLASKTTGTFVIGETLGVGAYSGNPGYACQWLSFSVVVERTTSDDILYENDITKTMTQVIVDLTARVAALEQG